LQNVTPKSKDVTDKINAPVTLKCPYVYVFFAFVTTVTSYFYIVDNKMKKHIKIGEFKEKMHIYGEETIFSVTPAHTTFKEVFYGERCHSNY
jgi:hypothetical protein